MAQTDEEIGPLDDLVHSQVFMVTPTDPPNPENRHPTASGSSQWTIPTETSYSVPTLAPDASIPERENAGDSQGNNG